MCHKSRSAVRAGKRDFRRMVAEPPPANIPRTKENAMHQHARLLVLSALALVAVACSYATTPAGEAAPPAVAGYPVVRGATTAAVRTDVQRPRDAAASPVRRECPLRRGATC
jgi:hypothetical protein